TQQENIPLEDQLLTYHGKPLQNNSLLQDYGIKDADTLFLSLRLKGGMYQKLPTDEPSHAGSGKKNEEIKIVKAKKNKTTIDDVIEEVMSNKNLLPPGYEDEGKGIKAL